MIVVFGGFGKTGRGVARRLRAEGHGVRLVTRSSAREPAFEDRAARHGCEVAVARLSDERELRRALQGARAVYALLPDDLRAEQFHAERRAMADAMASALKREAVPRVVLLSSSTAALGEDGRNGFGADLAYFERVLSETNAALTILRASYFQDNAVEMLASAERDGVYPSFFPTPGTRITTIAADDVAGFAASALLGAARAEREVVDLLGPAYSANEMAATIGALVGRSVAVVEVPRAQQEPMFRQWMAPEAARAMLETLECLASGRLVSRGDRVEYGATRLDQVLRAALARVVAAPSEVRP